MTELKQTANTLSFSLYGVNMYANEGRSDSPTPTGGIEKQLEQQEDDFKKLQDNIDALATYTGAEKGEEGTYSGPVDYFSMGRNGLIIGSTQNPILLQVTNESIQFVNYSTQKALVTINTTGMHSQENVLSTQINMFNNWAFRKGAPGGTGNNITYNLNDVWTGGPI